MSEVVIDLNRVTRAEFREHRNRLALLKLYQAPEGGELTPEQQEENDRLIVKREQVMAAFYEKVVIAWPFDDKPISVASYLSLGMLDAMAVDNAFTEAMKALGQKN